HVSGQGEQVLVGCAGEWNVEPVCVFLRHRLAADGGAAAGQGAGADSSRSVRKGVAGGRDQGGAEREQVSGGVLWGDAAGIAEFAGGDSGAGVGVCAIGHAEFSGGFVWAPAAAGVCRPQNDSGTASRQGGVVPSAGAAVRGGAWDRPSDRSVGGGAQWKSGC